MKNHCQSNILSKIGESAIPVHSEILSYLKQDQRPALVNKSGQDGRKYDIRDVEDR